MATLIKPDGTRTKVKPANGKNFTLGELRTLVGCQWVEVAYINGPKGSFLVVDEEGKLNGKAYNTVATGIYGHPGDYIVGNALLCKDGEVK
jgi:hypothetical protein